MGPEGMGDIGPKQYTTGRPEAAPASTEASDADVFEASFSPQMGALYRQAGEVGADVPAIVAKMNALGEGQIAEDAYDGLSLADREMLEPRTVMLANGHSLSYTRNKRGVFEFSSETAG
ncbi:MAG TPA: hypothetical protein VHO23_01695 [Candidatus Paceibacterota bacterium]|nr:hypothetical protein [Candidatus Paceibacterota bacterium]